MQRRRRHRFSPWVRKIPWRREWLPSPVFLPGEFHWQRSLADYSPWVRKKLDTMKPITLLLWSNVNKKLFWNTHSHIYTKRWLLFCVKCTPIKRSLKSNLGEGNGNPLQYSCLENPVDRGAWWAAVHGVTQSRTRLKRLSSSSSNNSFLRTLFPSFNIKSITGRKIRLNDI